MNTAYIALGSNLDHPLRQLRQARSAISDLRLTELLRCSSVYQTDPLGYADQPDFYNAVCAVATDLSPQALLSALQGIEHTQGRVRLHGKNGPRTLDLDILLYADQVVKQPDLVIPHAHMLERAFVIIPLLEIAPDLIVPGAGPLQGYLKSVKNQGIRKLQKSWRG